MLLNRVYDGGQIHAPVDDTIKPVWQVEHILVALHVMQYDILHK